MVNNEAKHLDAVFAALADPTRRAILARLTSGEASVTELAKPFDMSLPAISKHLKVLENAGLIARGREAQWRPCRLDAARSERRLMGEEDAGRAAMAKRPTTTTRKLTRSCNSCTVAMRSGLT